jgi:hypothetical protein
MLPALTVRCLRPAGCHPAQMSGPTEAGEHQRIEVQYTLEDEVLIIDHIDDPPEDFGEALARTLQADDAADGERELVAGLGGTSASVQRVSRRPK